MKKVDKIRMWKDEFYIEQALNWIEQIRAVLKILQEETIYTLDGNKWNYFLYKDTIIVADIEYPNGLKENANIYTIIMLCDNPKTTGDIKITAVRENNEEKYTAEEFFVWLNSPCVITEMVDVSNLEVVKFLQQYKETDFKTNRYQFYINRDNDFSLSYNIYAKDLKTNNTLKIYVEMSTSLQTVMPKSNRDVFVYDLSGKATKYQITQCKKAFMDFILKECSQLQVNNFYALELVKQTIQPVEQDWGRFVSVVFEQTETGFAEIYVDDFLTYDKKPYFVIETQSQNGLKTAVLDFYNPKYKTTGIYKNGHNKSKFWQLNKEEIKQLTEFLNSPCSENRYKKYNNINTNWQYLIARYNDNTGNIHDEEVASDLIMPNYLKLEVILCK